MGDRRTQGTLREKENGGKEFKHGEKWVGVEEVEVRGRVTNTKDV